MRSAPRSKGASGVATKSSSPAGVIVDPGFLKRDAFVRRLHLEQKRTERSRRPFVLMLLESATLFGTDPKGGAGQQIRSVLSSATRETDIKGWQEEGKTIGVIFTELGSTDAASVGQLLDAKLRVLLSDRLTAEQLAQLQLSFYVFPEDWTNESRDRSAAGHLYHDSERSQRAPLFIKRCIDVAGSLTLLLLTSPIFLVICLVVKLTSKGPALFRQQRVGQYGRRFTFLKFRSMYRNNDTRIHEEFVKRLIEGTTDSTGTTYKLTNDPRITTAGKFLRKTSLDELPQLLNVLTGEMSLVGPRPPLPYEVDRYDIWHRRRLLAVKPGITGLWQVKGRSRTTFDEMVRLDLQYAKSWSLSLDLKILIQTPRAVVAGDGAY